MNFSASIVVRQNITTGETVAGFASNLPRESREWKTIASFGRWFGSQMSYAPFRRAMSNARKYAEYCNGLASAA